MNPKVDTFLSKAKNWQSEMEQLRSIVLGSQLMEELKWKQPCYTFQGSNIVIIGAFKDYCALLFFKGSLLQDSNKILVKSGEHIQAGRQIRFTNIAEIVEKEAILKVYEAMEVEKAGLKVDYKASKYIIPDELQIKLAADPTFRTAFKALTPGRQRAYNLHFSGAKQLVTRASRIEKYRQKILNGKGINDCTCGLSKKMPTCDGSHKYL